MPKHIILLCVALCCLSVCSAQNFILPLNAHWQFRHAGSANTVAENWLDAEVPGTIHTDLLAHHLIPDPFFGNNEDSVQWVEHSAWIYRNHFTLSRKQLSRPHLLLVFDGLDTDAEVRLNGKKILAANNMFRQWRIDITNLAKEKNELIVIFTPAGDTAAQKKSRAVLPYPDNERVFVRKAQYQFGWDWAPRLVTCGIWKAVRLEAFDKSRPDPPGSDLRWHIQLHTEKDSLGTSFYFTRHQKRIFIRGANWVPCDNFLPRAVKARKYEQLISAASKAHINMLRVWGGGVYEEDVFYDLCDKYGIMVWQDFMFAGALYPADSAFVQNVTEEVRYQVKRLRKHPCIALWCGNNEISEAWFNWGWQQALRYSTSDSLAVLHQYRSLFEKKIADIVKELDPHRSYWPSSPSIGWGRDSAYLNGDVHYWGVWWGREPVVKYRSRAGRFVSEYGMQGMPDLRTLERFAGGPDLDTASMVMRAHQKHPFGWENIAFYIRERFPVPKNFQDLVYVSQLMQADALRIAIETHRGNMPVTMGSMFWQFNDCWPVTSWSIIDYFGRKKAAYFEVKRNFEDLLFVVDSVASGLQFRLISDSSSISEFTLQMEIYPTILTQNQPVRSKANTIADAGKLIVPSGLLFQGIGSDSTTTVVRMIARRKGSVVKDQAILFCSPKNLKLGKPAIKMIVSRNSIELSTDRFAYGVELTLPEGYEIDDNFFHLFPGQKKIVTFTSRSGKPLITKNIGLRSLADIQ